MLHDGLYEQVINKGLDRELANADKLSQTAPIDTAEASRVLAKYVAEVVERGRLKQKKLTSTRSRLLSGRSSFLRFLTGKTASGRSMRRHRLSVRKPQSHNLAYSPARFTSHRCTRSSKRRSCPAIGSTCWFPSSSGAGCVSSWMS